MPITQQRFREVLNAANAVLGVHRQLIDLVKPIRQSITSMREADRLAEAEARAEAKALITRDVIGYATVIGEILMQASVEYQELFAIIRAEKKYFDRVGRLNDKHAERQKMRRIRQAALGSAPTVTIDDIPADGPSTEPEPEKRGYTPEELEAWRLGVPVSRGGSAWLRAKGLTLTPSEAEPVATTAPEAEPTITLPDYHPGVTEDDIPIAKVGNIPPDKPVIPPDPDGVTDTSKDEKEPS